MRIPGVSQETPWGRSAVVKKLKSDVSVETMETPMTRQATVGFHPDALLGITSHWIKGSIGRRVGFQWLGLRGLGREVFQAIGAKSSASAELGSSSGGAYGIN